MARYKKGWSANHQTVFQLYIEGIEPKDIANRLKWDVDQVRRIINCVKFQELHAAVEKDSVAVARKKLEAKLIEAAQRIIRIMQVGKPDDRIRFEAAKEILYQCGMKPVEVVETRQREYTPEEIQSSLTVIKEVQAIEEKLSTQGSGFLLKPDAEASLSAPVSADTTATVGPVENLVTSNV
jgi:hypothetical protein